MDLLTPLLRRLAVALHWAVEQLRSESDADGPFVAST
jgi:hypothetical protein